MPTRKIKVDHPDRRVSTGAYSDGVVIDGWMYVSGQASLDLATGKVLGDTIEEQTRITLENVEKILKAGGCTRDDVVKCTVHLTDVSEFPRYNAVYSAFFSGVRPARTTVQSVLGPGMKIEIDAVARLSNP
ncbi:MAG: RidA family protein [Planctomycetes bacterium]|nr:RidA family protein [Planctomycetota bacterium]